MGKPRERAPNDKIKKKGGKRPRLAATRRMTAKLREELSQKRRDQEPNAAVAAEEQVEAYTVDTFSAAASTAGQGLDRASQALRERRVEHPDRDLEVDEPPAYPTKEADPSIHNAPPPGENTERIVFREKEDGPALFPFSRQKGEFPPEPPVSRGPAPQPGERMKREAIREKRGENVRGSRETYKAQSTEPEAPPDPPPTFSPREKQVAPREKPAQVLQARERPSTAPPTSRSEVPEVPSPDLPPQPPPPGERMRQMAIKERESKTIQTGGGERESSPLSISPADSPAEPREAPPAGSRWTERSPAARQAVDLPDRGGQDMGADPGIVPPATSGIYTGDRPSAGKRRSPVIRERARGDAQIIREYPRPTGGPGERQTVKASAPRTRREAAVPGGGAARARGRPVAPRASKAPRAARAAAKTAAGRSAQARARQLAVGQARQAAKATASLSRKAVTGAVKAAAAMVSAMVDGLQRGGMVSCLKHFPGHGSTETDSHQGKSVSNRTVEELESCEWIPFQAGIDKGAAMVMVSHLTNENLSDLPADLSPEVIGYLRGELGFDGLIVTDSHQMGAITDYYTSGEAAVLALKAGVDMVLMPMDLQDAFDGVMDALEDGTLTQARIDESVLRILAVKYSFGILA